MRLNRFLALGLAGALAATGAALSVAPTSAAPTSAAPTGCSGLSLGQSIRAGDLARSRPAAFKAAVSQNADDVPDLATRALTDKTLWLDRCGRALYVEKDVTPADAAIAEAGMGAAVSAAGTVFGNVPLDQTLTLSSKPGSNRTIYLDFTGGTVTGTVWNNSYGEVGAPIVWEPYSIDGDVSTSFSDAELTEMQKVWQVVAEDYAPFDVNVTTQYPGEAAIQRTTSADLSYGTRVAITNGGPIRDECSCGGVAFVGSFDDIGTGHDRLQPVWVFSNGTTKNGKYMGEAASHEAGHSLGLNHDGTSGGDGLEYYSGYNPWAPIMGNSYAQPISQWSRGQYPRASNVEDDVAKISANAPFRTDEDASGPVTLTNGQSLDGIVSRSTDIDTYTVTAAGTVTIAVDNGGPFPDLDVLLKVTKSGAVVATANPPAARVSAYEASGMNASVTFAAPAAGATYKVTVQGAGQGTPSSLGYSNYGSLGAYRISLDVTPPVLPPPVTVAAQSASGSVGAALSKQLVAGGGTGAYTWAKTAGSLPSGISLSKAGLLSGTPYKAGTYTFTATATSGTQSGSGSVTITVGPALAWVTAATLPKGKVGTPYAVTIGVTGGVSGYTWALSSGKLPLGLTLAGGSISGTPTKSGYASFTLKVTDASGKAISRTFYLNVGA